MKNTDALIVAPRFLLCFLALRNVDHDAAELAGAFLLDNHSDDIAEPYETSVSRHHPVFEPMKLLFLCCLGTKGNGPFTIFGMDVIGPEIGLIDPAFFRIAEDSFRLLADKGEAKGSGISFPHDAVDGVDKIFVSLLGLPYRVVGAL